MSSSIISFSEPSTAEEIKLLAGLAREIWTAHYVPIIGLEQVDYMLDKFQNEVAICQQLEQGYRYFMIYRNEKLVGYIAFILQENNSSLFLSKFYIKANFQGSGIGRTAMEFIEQYCRSHVIHQLWLTVNKHNTGAISFYNKVGFKTLNSLVQDIGSGFLMDDYKMEKYI